MDSNRLIKYKAVIEAVLNPNPQFPCIELYAASSTRVYRVDTPEPVIVKIALGDEDYYAFQADLLERIADKDGLTARILHWEMREIDSRTYGIQIQTYLPGTPLDNYPNRAEACAIVKAIYELHRKLCTISSKFDATGIPTIDQTSKNLLAMVDDCPMKEIGNRLLENKRYNELISQEEHCLVYCDIWPQNLLLEYKNEGIKVRIVDIDPLIFGPKVLQPAILLSSCFLILSVLHASDKSRVFDLDELLGYWPESLNRQDVLLMMQVFPVMLGLHKAYQFPQNPSISLEAHQSNMGLLMKCLQTLQEWGA